MKAFTDTEVSKDQLLAVLAGHRQADNFAQGRYWEGERGCAIGCALHEFRPGEESNWALYEPLFGIPKALARLKDFIFEGLAPAPARAWPERFAAAIPEGSDLGDVVDRFSLWLLTASGSPIHPWCDQPVVTAVAALVRRRLAGDAPAAYEWAGARYPALRVGGDAAKAALEIAAGAPHEAAAWAVALPRHRGWVQLADRLIVEIEATEEAP